MPIVQQQPETPGLGENPASNPRAVMGGNEPPVEEQIAMEFRDDLLNRRGDFMVRMEAAIANVDKASVTDDESCKLAGDLDKILRACEGLISEAHQAVKRPYLERGRACDAEKNRLIDKITPARLRLRDMMNSYLAAQEAKRRAEEAARAAAARAAAEEAERAERAARAAEEAAQKAAAEATNEDERLAAKVEAARAQHEAQQRIEEAQLAAAPTAKVEPLRSDTGTAISTRKVWQSEVVDYDVAFKAVSDNPKVREAIDKAVAALVKAGKRTIDGVKTWEAVTALTR